MARRKNVKRIDPRYFLHETVNRGEEELKEAEFQDTGFPEEDYEANIMAAAASLEGEDKPSLGSKLGRYAILEAVGEILADVTGWFEEDDETLMAIDHWKSPQDFLNDLQKFTLTYAGEEAWQEVVSRLDLRM